MAQELFKDLAKWDVEARVREGVKAVLEEVLEEEMSEHLNAGYQELAPIRKGERNDHMRRMLRTCVGILNLLTPGQVGDVLHSAVRPLPAKRSGASVDADADVCRGALHTQGYR